MCVRCQLLLHVSSVLIAWAMGTRLRPTRACVLDTGATRSELMEVRTVSSHWLKVRSDGGERGRDIRVAGTRHAAVTDRRGVEALWHRLTAPGPGRWLEGRMGVGTRTGLVNITLSGIARRKRLL